MVETREPKDWPQHQRTVHVLWPDGVFVFMGFMLFMLTMCQISQCQPYGAARQHMENESRIVEALERAYPKPAPTPEKKEK